MTVTFWGLSAPAWLTTGDFPTLLPLFLASLLFLLYRPETPRLKTAVPAAFLVFVAAHFWILRSHSAFLGDGALFINMLRNGESFYPSNLFDFFLHARLYQSVLRPLEQDPMAAYSLLSGIAGILFLFAMTATVRLWAPESRMHRPLILLLIFTGYTALFFGYVESYALLFAVTALYLYTAMRTLSRRASLRPPVLLFLLASAFHQTAILLLPSLVFLFLARHRTEPLARREILTAALCSVAFPILFIGLFTTLGFDFRNYLAMLGDRGVEGTGNLFLPLLNQGYSALSAGHLLDFLNSQLLASPAAVVVLPVLLILRRRLLSDPITQFLIWASVPLFVFFFLLDPKIGLFRDWDLFSFPALPATLLTGRLLLTRKKEAGHAESAGAILLLLFLFIHAGSWVLLNHNEAAAFNRFKALVESPGRKPSPALAAHNFEQIADRYRIKGDLEQERAFRLKATEADSNPRHFNNLGIVEEKLGNWRAARRYYEQALSLDPGQFETHFNLGRVFYSLSEPESTVNSFARAVALRPTNIRALGCLADAYAQMGRKDDAMATYGRMLKIAPENAKIRGAMENLEKEKR